MGMDSCFEQRHRPHSACKSWGWGDSAGGSKLRVWPTLSSFSIPALGIEGCICCFVTELAPLVVPSLHTPPWDMLKAHTHWSLLHLMTDTNLLPLHLMLMFKWKRIVCAEGHQVALYLPVCIYLGMWCWNQPSGPISRSQLQNSMRFFRCVNSPSLGLVFLAEEPSSLGWKKQPSGLTKFLPWA